MKKIFQFVLSATLAGFFTLLPFAFTAFVLFYVFVTLREVGDEITENGFGPDSDLGLTVAILVGLVIFLVLFLTGVLITKKPGNRTSNWLEENLLNYIPGYLLVKGVAMGMVNVGTDQGIRPALLEQLPGVMELVFIIEEITDDRYTVFSPSSPNAGSGKVLIVRKELVHPVDANLMDLRETLSVFGVGAGRIVGKVK